MPTTRFGRSWLPMLTDTNDPTTSTKRYFEVKHLPLKAGQREQRKEKEKSQPMA